MLKLFLLVGILGFALGQDRPIVTIPQGQLQGIRETGSGSQSFISFKGIPYALPPVGSLRFRNPVPHTSWTGILDASDHRGTCPSSGWFGLDVGTGVEDCLYLNVYTSQLAGSRPVMVWIHGGSFTGGNGNSLIYGPSFLINSGNVVVVTINYRLGALGFLSTGDEHAQGNWGVKDMIEAMRWVRNNIHHFGGNPNQITAFGESAGSVGVHYLLLTQMGQGLYHRAIMQSGSAINPWAFQPNPLREATILAQKLGLVWSNNQDLINQLRNVPAATIVDNQQGWLSLPVPRGLTSFDWVPNVEPPNSPEYRFLTADPVTLMNRGDILHMPFIMGYTSIESLYMFHEQRLVPNPNAFELFPHNPHFYSYPAYNLIPGVHTNEINEVANAMRGYYFGNGHPSQENALNYSIYMTDNHFSYGVDRTVRYHARRQSQPIYYYKFGFDGSLNMIKRLLQLGDQPGAMHADDIFYLFDVTSFSLPMVPTNQAILVRNRMVRLWTNFAVFGDPTPITDALIPTRWARYTIQNEEIYDIEDNLSLSLGPHGGRLRKWHAFQDRFNPSYPG